MSENDLSLVSKKRPSYFNCRLCTYFEEIPGNNGTGICRRYPPDKHGASPSTGPTQWCGEWSSDTFDPPFRGAQTIEREIR